MTTIPDEPGDMGSVVAEARFVRAYPPAAPEPDETVLYLPFWKGDLLIHDDDTFSTAPAHPLLTPEAREGLLFLGRLDGVAVVAYTQPDEAAVPEGWKTVGLRQLWGRVGDHEYALAGYAAQLLHFHAHYRFCARCGNPTRNQPGTWGQECPVCGQTIYPPVSPAVLVLVHDGGDRVLLAQKSGWGKRYSILAGFVEPGESLEGCAEREVKEETGVAIRDPVYGGSQPWPFPHQVMVAFSARYAGGDIQIDEAELSHAAWFHRDELPELPPPLSLSRQTIDAWVASRRSD